MHFSTAFFAAVVSATLSVPSITAAQASNPPSAPPATGSFSGDPGKGVTFTTADERLSVNVRARAQLRATITRARGETTELVSVKTARLYVQGHVLSRDLKYVLQLAFGAGDFEELSPSPIFDAYVENSALRDLNVRVGQYFVPFDRARTVREFSLQLADRPVLIPELTLDRDVGITLLSNDLFGTGGKLAYALGVFGGDGRNRLAAARPGMLYVARIAFLPFGSFDDNSEGDLERRSSPRLAIGIAGAYNQRTDRQRSTTGTRYTLGGFNYLHGAADLVFKWAGVSLLAEVVLRKGHRESRAGMSDDGKAVTEYSRSAWGYLAQLGVMVSSQVELAGRWGHMSTLGKTDPKLEQLIAQSGHEATLGANWYINGHFFKLQADAGLRFGKWENPREYVARLQLDASF